MNVCIVVMTHLKKEDVLYHYNWHKNICDVKVIWQTQEKIDHPDIFLIDIPGNIVVPIKMRIYCHYAKRLNYDYILCLDSDCFILKKDFLNMLIKYMTDKKSEVCFTQITDKLEHYKFLFYDYVRRHYNTEMIMYSYNIATVLTKNAVKYYDENNHYKIYDEVDFPSLMINRLPWCSYSDLNYHVYSAGKIDKEKITQITDTTKLIHAVKDYKIMDNLHLT